MNVPSSGTAGWSDWPATAYWYRLVPVVGSKASQTTGTVIKMNGQPPAQTSTTEFCLGQVDAIQTVPFRCPFQERRRCQNPCKARGPDGQLYGQTNSSQQRRLREANSHVG